MSDRREHAAQLTQSLADRLRDGVAGDAAVSRRAVLGALGVAGAGVVGLSGRGEAHGGHDHDESPHGNFGAVGEFESTDFDPHAFLRQFNTGFDGQDGLDQRVYERDDGEGGTERVREFDFFATLSDCSRARQSSWAVGSAGLPSRRRSARSSSPSVWVLSSRSTGRSRR